MWFVTLPASYPVLFWLIAILWSAFQGYAGREFGFYIFDHARNGDSEKKTVRQLAYGFHHGAFYFLSSLSGFVAWSLVHSISEKIPNWSEVAAGSGAILVALGGFSVLGISGALARILYMGNRPA
ncbi:MAG: hypothetical protein Q7R79_04015 [bacterium]|nr:hypothetical protein [bacterium]